MEAKELWKDIPGCKNYQVSNIGRIKSFAINPIGVLLGLRRHYKGYMETELMVDGIKKKFKVHRLVGLAFIPNPDDKPQINHIDGTKDNNIVSNLEWCTNGENQIHAYKNNLNKRRLGEDAVGSKLKKEQVLIISNSNDSIESLASQFETCLNTIRNIKNGDCWGSVTGITPKLKSRLKLTKDQAIFVKSSNLTHRALSKKFNVSASTINSIKNNITWKEI